MCIYIYIYRERERERERKEEKKAQPTMSSYATENYYLQFLLIREAISTQPYVSPQLTDIIIFALLIKGKSKKESHFCPIELERERELLKHMSNNNPSSSIAPHPNQPSQQYTYVQHSPREPAQV